MPCVTFDRSTYTRVVFARTFKGSVINDETVRDELTARMTEKVGYGPSDYFQIGAAVASNAGPKVVGTIFNVKKELR